MFILKFEILKLLGNKIILICIIVSILLSIYYADKTSDSKNGKFSDYEGTYTQDLYNKIENEYTLAKTKYELVKNKHTGVNQSGINQNEVQQNEVQQNSNLLEGFSSEDIKNMSADKKKQITNNFYEWSNLMGKANLCKNVIDYRSKVVKVGERLKTSSDEYTSAVNKKIVEMYSQKVNFVIRHENISDNIVDNKWKFVEYSDYINIIAIIINVCGIFIIEHNCNTYSMIYSSFKSRKELYMKKVAVAVLISFVLAITTTVLQIIFLVKNDSFSDVMGYDIQNVSYFQHSPYDIKMYQLWIIIGLLRFLGYLTIVMIVTFITTFFKKSIVPFSIGTVMFCGGFALFSRLLDKMNRMIAATNPLDSVQDKYDFYTKYTPLGLIRDGIGYFSEYKPNNIFDKPISNLTISIVTNLTYCTIFMISGYVVYVYRFRKSGI